MPSTQIALVQNWFEDQKRRARTRRKNRINQQHKVAFGQIVLRRVDGPDQ
jgi:hypothetical protein